MFGNGSLTFREFAMREPLPRSTTRCWSSSAAVVTRSCSGRRLFNAYVDESRMTQDVDIVSPRAAELAEELREYLHQRFGIAVQVRSVKDGVGYRVYQVRKPANRHLVDVRPVKALPPAKRVRKVLVVTPPELIANKVISMIGRQHQPKGMIDRANIYRLLLAFPHLKTEEGPVAERLGAHEAGKDVIAAWKSLVAEEILAEGDEDEFAT